MTGPRPPYVRLRFASKGFIVVAVLWIMSALATLAAIYAIYIANVGSSIAVDDDRLQNEALVVAALELTALQLTAAQSDAPPTHGHFVFRAGHATVAVQFKSESARVDLNRAPKELLAGLFEVLGASPEQAKSYADNIVAWRTPPRPQTTENEASRYLQAGLSYGPRGGPFAHPDELWLVRDIAPELVERAMPLITVYSGIAGISAVEAVPEVIAALPRMTPERLNTLLQQRETGDARSASKLLDPAQAGVAAEASKATRVDVQVDFENRRRVDSEAVITIADDNDVPYRILSWRDGFDDPARDK